MDESELLRQELARERRARKQAEALLEEKSLELYRGNQELAAKAQALARSNDELEQFAYVASHDLQAPLRSIAGCSQLLMRRHREHLDEKAAEYLEYIDSGAKKLQRMINDLLEFSRAGRIDYQMEHFDAQVLAAEVCAQLHNMLEARQAEVSFSGLPEIYGDRMQLGRVLQNLIDNGIKFQPDGARPRVELKVEDEPAHWRFCVRDNGIGIDTEHLSKIFGVFVRLHHEEKFPGTGVGLPICKKIVERHGGRIWVESAAGMGTSFHFTLAKPADPTTR